MRHARYILAATLMATALCADRAMLANDAVPTRAESARVVTLAEKWASRFSNRLNRVAVPFRLERISRNELAHSHVVCIELTSAQPAHQPTAPFQFRLPPPAC